MGLFRADAYADGQTMDVAGLPVRLKVSARARRVSLRVDRVGRQSPGVPDRWIRRAVRERVAERHVARSVNRNAGHVAPECVRTVRVPCGRLDEIARREVFVIPKELAAKRQLAELWAERTLAAETALVLAQSDQADANQLAWALANSS